MRKRIVDPSYARLSTDSKHGWLDLRQIATVELTSEDPLFPIDSALNADAGGGWRASQNGEQIIRLVFDEPISLCRIQFHFLEGECERTQEFILRWSSVSGGTAKQIVRQQWNFSPAGSTSEVEDYHVSLDDVSVLELAIQPDIKHHAAPATLAMWRLA
jgi:hypothetical protein